MLNSIEHVYDLIGVQCQQNKKGFFNDSLIIIDKWPYYFWVW
jgi:hypothetical protein